MSSEVSRTRDQYLTSRDSSTPLGITIKTVDFMSNSPNHNCAHLAVILNEAKDLAHEAWDTLDEKRDPTSYERFLAPLGMTLRAIL